jgi:hypothetical protein
MALKAVYESADEIPEGVKSEYKEVNGKWIVDVTDVDNLPRVAALKDENAKRRIELKTTKDTLAKFGDLNPDEVHTQMARIPELEELAAGKVDDKKIDKLVESRLAAKVAPIQRELDVTKTKLNETTQTLDQFRTKEKTRTIHDSVRAAASKAKVRPEAMEDALLYGERVLDVDESGSVVTKDGVGVTPGLDPFTLFTELQPKRPHWWGESIGGGGGGGGGGRMATNPFTAEHWNLTEQGKLINSNRAQAENLAKAAGTTIGGGKPAPRAK